MWIMWYIYGISNFLKRHPWDILIFTYMYYIHSISLVLLCFTKMHRPGGWCRRSCPGPAAPVQPTIGICGPYLQLDFLHARTSSPAYGRPANMCPDSSECGVGRNKHATIHTTKHTNWCVWVMNSVTANIKTSPTELVWQSSMSHTSVLESLLL